LLDVRDNCGLHGGTGKLGLLQSCPIYWLDGINNNPLPREIIPPKRGFLLESVLVNEAIPGPDQYVMEARCRIDTRDVMPEYPEHLQAKAGG
jgi:hypothetical protein